MENPKIQEFPKLIGAIFGSIWASPGPRVAVNGRASSRSPTFCRYRRTLGSGKPFRGHFRFENYRNPNAKTIFQHPKRFTNKMLVLMLQAQGFDTHCKECLQPAGITRQENNFRADNQSPDPCRPSSVFFGLARTEKRNGCVFSEASSARGGSQNMTPRDVPGKLERSTWGPLSEFFKAIFQPGPECTGNTPGIFSNLFV